MENKFCPHCGSKLLPVETPEESTWGGEIHMVCFNDECRYYKDSWEHMARCGALSTGYRLGIDPRGSRRPVLVWSSEALKDHIVNPDKPLSESEKVYLRKVGYILPEDWGNL